MGFKKALITGIVAGLAMGLALFLVGAIAARVTYGPQFAPEGKFEPQQLNPFYFFWTKIAIGVFFGLLMTLLYEALPLSRRIASVAGGLKYAFWLWLVVYLWGLSHPLVYEKVMLRHQLFWTIYTLGGFLGYGAMLGWMYKRGGI
ncbi:MAG: hypothetical protein ONB44_11290 [candidate division KSB1 bacterium]|nr:hypothetical protein [candidate division KSB1 bacterium]MDZ7302707.1 hypothetical protein [candidate division KSB1 bacterium]MDZ7311762.1 hypothetical protein [candidate division KSB1 bacterium]